LDRPDDQRSAADLPAGHDDSRMTSRGWMTWVPPLAVDRPQERTFGAIDYGALEAGVMVMAVPCVALFLALQRHYVQGFTTGALRG
jgi:ABC-type glycerol-3-phosphate transport system permease component